MQEHQDQQSNGLIKMDLSACCQRITGGEQQQRPIAAIKSPSPQLHPQQNNQKHSQLKESHSALVKILESAPIKQKSPLTPAPITGDSHLTAAIVNNSNSSEMRHSQYRKRVKHSICDNHDRNSSGDDDDQSSVASVERTPAGVLSTAAEVLCPWKKTRIAREWRQKKETTVQDGTVAVDAKLPLTGGMERMVIDDGDDEEEDEDDDVDSSCECGNKLSWRRVSSDSNDSCISHQHTDSSSCDSDCLENISDLCKKFNENLSENDVNIPLQNINLFHLVKLLRLRLKS